MGTFVNEKSPIKNVTNSFYRSICSRLLFIWRCERHRGWSRAIDYVRFLCLLRVARFFFIVYLVPQSTAVVNFKINIASTYLSIFCVKKSPWTNKNYSFQIHKIKFKKNWIILGTLHRIAPKNYNFIFNRYSYVENVLYSLNQWNRVVKNVFENPTTHNVVLYVKRQNIKKRCNIQTTTWRRRP